MSVAALQRVRLESLEPDLLATRARECAGRAERAWVSAMNAHVRAALVHESAAALHALRDDAVRAGLEGDRAAAERAAFDAAVARHPERVAPVRPAGWPGLVER